MSPDSSYGRYDVPTSVDHSLMSSMHKEREPELHIGKDFNDLKFPPLLCTIHYSQSMELHEKFCKYFFRYKYFKLFDIHFLVLLKLVQRFN